MGGGGKETPRQKMIGMMYLVLTALLAMNVSKDILEAFVVINDGLETTNEHFRHKNDIIYSQFANAKLNDPKKVTPFFNKAEDVKKEADAVYDYIEELKKHLIMHTDAIPQEVADTLPLKGVNSKDNYDKPTEVLIGPEVTSPKEGEFTAMELKGKLIAFRESLVGHFDAEKHPDVVKGLEEALELKKHEHSGVVEEWEISNFYHLPLAAVITNLSKIQADIRQAEGDAVKELLGEVTAEDFKFDTLAAKVIAPTNYVLTGEEYVAEVMVAAFSTTQQPLLQLGDVDTTKMEIIGEPDTTGITMGKGSAMYRVRASSEGLKKWGGLIGILKPGGDPKKPEDYKKYKFESEYMVARPSATVAPTKMNVFYIGVDNPVSVSAAGVAKENIRVSMSGGSISKGGDSGYIVRVTKPGKCTVTVSADFDGKTKSMGSSEFRVKRVPDPKPFFGGKGPGDDKMKKATATAQSGVVAKMENFDFDLKFKVTAFSLTVLINGVPITREARGNKLTPEMKKMIKKAKKNQKIYIENIKAKGPDGSTRKLGTLTFKMI